MKFGLHTKMNKFYIHYSILKFQLRKFFLGFENAVKLLLTLDKRALIPILKKNGAKIGVNCDIETPLLFHNCKNFKNLIIDNNCHIGKGTFLDLKSKIEIKSNVTISMQVSIITHQDFGYSELQKLYPTSSKSILIEKNVYIGANSTILMGVILRESSLIAAGSVVLKTIPPHSIAAGIPANILKKTRTTKYE